MPVDKIPQIEPLITTINHKRQQIRRVSENLSSNLHIDSKALSPKRGHYRQRIPLGFVQTPQLQNWADCQQGKDAKYPISQRLVEQRVSHQIDVASLHHKYLDKISKLKQERMRLEQEVILHKDPFQDIKSQRLARKPYKFTKEVPQRKVDMSIHDGLRQQIMKKWETECEVLQRKKPQRNSFNSVQQCESKDDSIRETEEQQFYQSHRPNYHSLHPSYQKHHPNYHSHLKKPSDYQSLHPKAQKGKEKSVTFAQNSAKKSSKKFKHSSLSQRLSQQGTTNRSKRTKRKPKSSRKKSKMASRNLSSHHSTMVSTMLPKPYDRIYNRIHHSQVAYNDSQHRNQRHQNEHLKMTYAQEKKLRKEVINKIDNQITQRRQVKRMKKWD